MSALLIQQAINEAWGVGSKYELEVAKRLALLYGGLLL